MHIKDEADMQHGKISVGTSGIVLPGSKLTFPDEFKAGTRLHYYGALFNSLEINSSFYKIPMSSTFEKWASEVPDTFTFTVKLWRGITHVKKLLYNPDDLNIFMRAANHLGRKRGCLLVQFPPAITVDEMDAVEKIIRHLRWFAEQDGWRLAIEVRHISWHQESACMMLEKYDVALVIHDMPGSKTPMDYLQRSTSSGFVYLRFHGPAGDYTGSYTEKFIQQYADRIKELSRQQVDVYIYFNNTIEGALENAQLLQKLIS